MRKAGAVRSAAPVSLFCLVCACSQPAPDRSSVARSAGAPSPVAAALPSPAKPATPSAAQQPSGEAEPAAAKVDTKATVEELKAEEPEANPYSESVTLKVSVTPPAKAVVMWGAKQLAKLTPGSMDAEIVRPRGSGPLDLEIKADGYLPYHTRLYTDRDEKTNVRLYRSEDAPGLFGYRRTINPSDKKR